MSFLHLIMAFIQEKNWVSATPGNAKFYDYQTSAELKCPSANMYMLRYSEVLLNYAEAKIS